MSREKQIEEMVQVLAEAHHEMDVAWTNHFIDGEKFPKPKPERLTLAEHLYNKGYRKAGDVTRDTIDAFMNAMRIKHEANRPIYGGALALLLPDIEQIADEFKKKYTESEDTE